MQPCWWRKEKVPTDTTAVDNVIKENRMKIEVTTRIRQLLTEATESPRISQEQKHEILRSFDEDSVSFSLVKTLCLKLRQKNRGPWIDEVCKGSKIILRPPPKRQKSPELLKRLEELQNREDERKYQAMVKNVAKGDFVDTSFQLLPSFRLQIAFGAQVVLTMVVFYLLGSYGSRMYSTNPTIQALGGVLGLTFGLILETTLFIIRSIPTENTKRR